MQALKEINKQDLAALAIITLFILIFFKPVIAGDGFTYYALLQGIVDDHSLNLEKQAKAYAELENTSGMHMTGWLRLDPNTGRYVTDHSFGFSMLAIPAYSASLVLDDFRIFHIKDEFFLKTRGDILIHMASVAFTSYVFLYLGLLVSLLVIKKFYSKKNAALVLLLLFFGSPLLRYATYDISYTHCVEIGLMALIVFLFLKEKNPAWIGFIAGLLTAIRITSGIFFLPLIAYYAYRRKFMDAGKLVAGAIPFILLLMAYNTIQFGGPFTTQFNEGIASQASQSFYLPVHFIDLFLSDLNGFLLWTPLLVIALAGLFFNKSYNGKKWVFIAMVLSYLLFYSIVPYWWEGLSFGHRAFLVFLPIFMIGLSEVAERKPKLIPLLVALAVFTMVLYLFWLAFPPDSASLFSNLSNWSQHLAEFPKNLVDKVGFVRLIFET